MCLHLRAHTHIPMWYTYIFHTTVQAILIYMHACKWDQFWKLILTLINNIFRHFIVSIFFGYILFCYSLFQIRFPLVNHYTDFTAVKVVISETGGKKTALQNLIYSTKFTSAVSQDKHTGRTWISGSLFFWNTIQSTASPPDGHTFFTGNTFRDRKRTSFSDGSPCSGELDLLQLRNHLSVLHVTSILWSKGVASVPTWQNSCCGGDVDMNTRKWRMPLLQNTT